MKLDQFLALHGHSPLTLIPGFDHTRASDCNLTFAVALFLGMCTCPHKTDNAQPPRIPPIVFLNAALQHFFRVVNSLLAATSSWAKYNFNDRSDFSGSLGEMFWRFFSFGSEF